MTFLPESDLREVVAQVSPLWERLRGTRIFLTGGTGFFGIWLTESFLEANRALGLNAELTVLTRDRDAFLCRYPHLARESALRFHTGDVRSFESPPGAFEWVIHAATPVVPLATPEAAWDTLDTILTGTRRVLDFAGRAKPKRLLLTSSGAVYGLQPENLPGFPEDWRGAPDPLVPGSAYGEGKRAAEALCARHAATHGYEARIARCFAFVGPGLPLDGHFAIGNFIRDALDGRKPAPRGNPATVRSYLYASDLAAWLWTLLLADETPTAVNVGSGEAVTLEQLAYLVSRTLLPGDHAAPDSPVPPGPRYVPDVTLAERKLGLRPTINLENAILRTARHAGFAQ